MIILLLQRRVVNLGGRIDPPLNTTGTKSSQCETDKNISHLRKRLQGFRKCCTNREYYFLFNTFSAAAMISGTSIPYFFRRSLGVPLSPNVSFVPTYSM